MRNVLILFILISIPTISFAQLNFAKLNDGRKSSNTLKKKKESSSFSNSIIYSAAIPYAPFGIKYHYCNSFGFYASFKSDFEIIDGDYILTGGFAKSIGQKVNLYFGGGYDISYDEGVAEGGLILKFNRIAIDIGVGFVIDDVGYATVGIGYNF